MKLLIDANIVLDVLQARQPFCQDSSLIWKICETAEAEGFISVLTFANLVYIMRRELDPEQIEDVLGKLNLIFNFTDLDKGDLLEAAALRWEDFEDALQSVTAERIGADYIITRNVRDFKESKVMAFTPRELLSRM